MDKVMLRFGLIVMFPIAALGALVLGDIKQLIPVWRDIWNNG
jgi:hypothetical protein